LRNNNPSQPLVFLLAAPPAAHEWVDCLATKLAEKLDPRHERNLARIDVAEQKRYPGEKAKKNMDDFLRKSFLMTTEWQLFIIWSSSHLHHPCCFTLTVTIRMHCTNT